MMKKSLLPFVAFLTVSIGVAVAMPALSTHQEKEEKEKESWPPPAASAKISPVQAMAIAKKKMGGGVAFQANFEFDEGHWVYGVMIVKGHKITEVEVDPKTGKALDSETVTPDDEAKEMKSELTKVAAAGG